MTGLYLAKEPKRMKRDILNILATGYSQPMVREAVKRQGSTPSKKILT